MSRRSTQKALVAAARRAGVTDARVLDAVRSVPRESFVPPDLRGHAADDRPLRIGEDQTTSQPSLIATMVAALELDGTERVLEIGTGLGYEAALLGQLAAEVHTIERHRSLADAARRCLADAGCENVTVHVGDGTRGLPEHAPYDAVVIAAAAGRVPAAVTDQLVEGGWVVAPVGSSGTQQVVRYRAAGGDLVEDRRMVPVRFVPLVEDPR